MCIKISLQRGKHKIPSKIKYKLKSEKQSENEEKKQVINHRSRSVSHTAFLYPGRESNPHSEELDFESSASTNSATWALTNTLPTFCNVNAKLSFLLNFQSICEIFIKIVLPWGKY